MRAPDTNAAQQRAALVLFEAALEQTLAQRDAWLVDACAGDVALLAQVRALLAVDSAHDGFSAELDAEFDDEFGHAPGLGDATGGAVTTSGPHRWLPVRPPGQIGPYALDELIGSGGMGAVYRARRNDGLFDQTVAIKFVRPLRGRGSVQALVDAERRLLARMQHPGIAHILDGGTTDNGLHYLVMEFVQGVALDDHARDEGLDARGRVALLVPVCSAVAHAHQHLVLHCDIKPANILVTPDGRPKLIDFGVARLQDVLDAALPQGFTRAYSSPQRLAGEPPAVTDDVYSLGMVLVELLTGDVADPQTLAFAAPLDAELGAIARRALAPERAAALCERRTPSPTTCAAGSTHQPVAAMGAHWRYRARKLVQRHPWRVAAASLSLARPGRRRWRSSPRSMAAPRARAARCRDPFRPGALAGQLPALRPGRSTRIHARHHAGAARTGGAQPGLSRRAGSDGRQQPGTAARGRRRPGAAGRSAGRAGQAACRRSALRPAPTSSAPNACSTAWCSSARPSGPGSATSVACVTCWRCFSARATTIRRVSWPRPDRPSNTCSVRSHGALASKPRPSCAPTSRCCSPARASPRPTRTRRSTTTPLRRHCSARKRSACWPCPSRCAPPWSSSTRAAVRRCCWATPCITSSSATEALAAYRRATARFREGLMRAPLNRRLLEGTVIGHWNLSGTLDELGERALALRRDRTRDPDRRADALRSIRATWKGCGTARW